MKKVLFASTILASLGSVAHAETGVTFSGYGRFGVIYDEGRDAKGLIGPVDAAGNQLTLAADGTTYYYPSTVGVVDPATGAVTETTVLQTSTPVVIPNSNGNVEAYYKQNATTFTTRLRIDMNAQTETDSGVTFGGKIRFQYDDGTSSNLTVPTPGDAPNTTAQMSPALLYGKYAGFTVEVGNVNTALDSSPLFYDSELGLMDSSYGDSRSSFYAFSSGPYNIGRNGLSAYYSAAGFSGMLSYIDPNQAYAFDGKAEEYSVMASYTTGGLTFAGAGTFNGAGISGNDVWFIGAAYAINDQTKVGINYIDEGIAYQDGPSYGQTSVLYGSYDMSQVILKGYISYNNYESNKNNVAAGIGLDYDLGGATLKSSIQYSYDENVYADAGVKFNF